MVRAKLGSHSKIAIRVPYISGVFCLFVVCLEILLSIDAGMEGRSNGCTGKKTDNANPVAPHIPTTSLGDGILKRLHVAMNLAYNLFVELKCSTLEAGIYIHL